MGISIRPQLAFANGLHVLNRLPSLQSLRHTALSSHPCVCDNGASSTAYRGLCTRSQTTAVLRPRVAIVGGGFGGLMSAIKLASMPWTRLTRPEITLVDKADRFSFLPMMYELATGEAEEWEVAPLFETLLEGSSIRFVQAAAESVVLGNSPKLLLRPQGSDSPTEVEFDRAVLALGCEPSARDVVPGAAEHAVPLYERNSAVALREKIAELRETKGPGQVVNIIVVGAGYSGVECASCVAESLGSVGSVVLIDRGDRILSRGTDYNRVTAERALTEHGVVIQYRTGVEEVTADSITLKGKDEGSKESTLPADIVIWSGGVQPSSAIAQLGVPLCKTTGLIPVDKFLQVSGNEDRLFALGDGASMTKSDANGGYAGTAQVAAQQADYAAWNVWASLTARRKLEYRYVHLGEMLVLGAHDASVSSPLGVDAEGKAAWAMRRAAYLARMPTDRHRAKLAVNWAVAPAVTKVASQVKRPAGPTTP